jgi:hypothetical protein
MIILYVYHVQNYSALLFSPERCDLEFAIAGMALAGTQLSCEV